jgi:hypothetical protein
MYIRAEEEEAEEIQRQSSAAFSRTSCLGVHPSCCSVTLCFEVFFSTQTLKRARPFQRQGTAATCVGAENERVRSGQGDAKKYFE